mgnify:CR=1 FL=1
MSNRKPPFRADIVGSFLRPERLKEARRQAGLELDSTADDQGTSTLSMEELRAIEDECIRELVAFEESIGLKVVTDGEFRRGSWAYDAIGRFEGIDLRRQDGSYGATFVSGFQPPIAHADGKVGRKPGGIVLEDYKFTSSLTDRVVKATMPSPTLMFVRGGRDAVNREVYRRRLAVRSKVPGSLAPKGAGAGRSDQASGQARQCGDTGAAGKYDCQHAHVPG